MTPAPAATRAEQGYRLKPIILCVDDFRDILETLEQQLHEQLGYNYSIEKALSGEEAMEMIHEFKREGRPVAVIIADVIMPGMSGDELLVKAHEVLPETYKIMLTGEKGILNRITNAIRNASLYRYIDKPWVKEDMQLTVKEAAQSFMYVQTIEEQNRTLRLLHDGAQVIARQKVLHDISAELQRLILEFSGADSAMLLINQGGTLYIQSEVVRHQPIRTFNQLSIDKAIDIPKGLIQQVAASGHFYVSANALDDASLAGDRYFSSRPVRSLLCLPLVNQGRNMGVLYLERQDKFDGFPPTTIEFIQILVAQAAIAIENDSLRENLEDNVFEKTKQLLAVNSHKDEMIRIVSHEIRSPLSGIASLAGILTDKEIASSPTEVIRYGNMIQNSTSRVLKLANDILDLAKLESGTIHLHKAPVELMAFLRAQMTAFRPLAQTKGVDILLEESEPLEIMADESKLAQAVDNLISNSIKFTPKAGKVTLAVDSTALNGMGFARILVTDTGLGIPPDQMPRLFEKFGVKQRAGTAGEKGTGLGLAIVKELVQRHDGQITATSTPGKGTTFTILLPLN
jgi:signal transduction histidine kinase